MEILDYCIDTVKDFPLKKHYTIDKRFDHILGIVTKKKIDNEICEIINEKSLSCVSVIGFAEIDESIITFFGLKDIVSSTPLLNSINKYLGNGDARLKIYYVPTLKELCIDSWGDLQYYKIVINGKQINVKCL